MGCKQNSELITSLVEADHIQTQKVERVLRLVDRGIFVHPRKSEIAYTDHPFRSNNLHPGQIHISAPSIYCTVLEMLDLHNGQTFLNIGSGSGYLSAAVGFLIGENGTSHGIELHSNIIDHCREALQMFASQRFIAGYSWSSPSFVHGNAFQLKGISKRYDRIYVGAQIQQNNLAFFSEMLREDGIMIVPVIAGEGTRFTRVKRTSDGFENSEFMNVTFAELILPNLGDRPESALSSRKRKIIEEPTNPNDCSETVTEDLLDLFKPKSLELLSSYVIRRRICAVLRVSHPMAIVQRVRNNITTEEAVEITLRRHNRAAARRVNLWFNNDLPILLDLNDFDHRQVAMEEVAQIEERLADEAEVGEAVDARRIGGMEVNLQRQEERHDAAFNNEIRPGGENDEPFVMNQVINLMHRGVEARAQWEQQRRNALNDYELSENEDEEDDDHMGFAALAAERARRERVRRRRQLGMIRDAGDDWIEFRPFRMRTRRLDHSSDEETDEMRRPRGSCIRCGRVCKCIVVRSLKTTATKVMNDVSNSRLNRRAQVQAWVQRITRLTGPHSNPKSFADQLPAVLEEKIDSLPNGRLAIEDWYRQKKRDNFMGQLAALDDAVRETGKLQFEQESHDFQQVEALAESEKVFMVSFKNEEDSVSRFERKIVEVLNQLPLPENGKKALKWNLFRDD